MASALGLTVEGATSLPGLEGATGGESFTSPSSSSSSELCTSSADLIFDEAFEQLVKHKEKQIDFNKKANTYKSS